jgi:hypothetical protein
MNGNWKFVKQMGEGKTVGFIYVIHDKILDQFYLGKKLYRGTGMLNKGLESNWKTYKTSSKYLQVHFKERPMNEFDFICLDEYSTKGGLSYAETWSLCYVEAPTSDKWLNKRIEAISWNVKENVSNLHKMRLNKIINGEAL